VQITTGGACHLEIPLVERAFGQLPAGPLDFLFIEDVGNLVCPAAHDVGHHRRIIVQSVTEGDDKAGKYPKAFRTAHALIISKTDLLPYVPFSVDAAIADARRIRPDLELFKVCALNGAGIEEWIAFLQRERSRLLAE
jgi:hydrogenase nickel incorporation protein HypB